MASFFSWTIIRVRGNHYLFARTQAIDEWSARNHAKLISPMHAIYL